MLACALCRQVHLWHMGEIYAVRHGEAHRPLESDFGSLYSLTANGRDEILKTGHALRSRLSPRTITGIECAPTLRSLDAAKLLAGALETSAHVSEQSSLQHRGIEAPRLLFELNRWACNKKSGVYVCAMSRRALLALVAPVLGLTPAEINATECESDIQIPCASVTHLTVTERGLQLRHFGVSAERIISENG